MAEAHRYNKLGQILAAGGEIQIALLIAQGLGESELLSIISQRYPLLPEADVKELVGISSEIATAGEALNAQQLEDTLDLDLLPVNPALFGDESAGRRLRIVGQDQYADGTASPYVYIDLAVEQTIQDIIEQAINQLRDFIVLYPRMADYIQKESELDPEFTFVAAERKF